MNDIILKYLRGEALDEEKRILLEWLHANEANRRIFSEMRDSWLASGGIPVFSGRYVQEAFSCFISRIESEEEARRKIRWTYMLRIAVSVAILVACSFGGYFVGREWRSVVPQTETITMNRFIMGDGSKGSVLLPDGSVVWLNKNSVLVYPDHFAPETRKVRLIGEGYFEVTHKDESPFLVEMDGMTVKVLGTRFNICGYKDRGVIETTLISGKVEVTFPDMYNSITLKPNQKIVRDNRDGSYRLIEVDASDYILWIEDRLVCTNERLSAVLHKMGHWFHLEVECVGDLPLDHRLSLTIRNESPEEILRLLALICPISYTIERDKIVVSPLNNNP